MQNLEEDSVLQSQGLASVTFSLHWSDGVAEHEDRMHVEKFSAWRDADLLPAPIAARVAGMRAGDTARAGLAAGEATGAWDPARELAGTPADFDRDYRRGLHVDPGYGRFYPQGFFHGLQGIVHEAVEPARITALEDSRMRVDLNHPLARYPLEVVFQVEQVLPGSDRRGGRCTSPLDDLTRYPGLAAPVRGGRATDFDDHGQGMARMDERDDALFYSKPRLVQHLDTRALATANALYQRLLPGDAEVLDLMASHDSHLQGCSLRRLSVLGMNEDELRSNRAATDRVVQDLNTEPALPGADASLGAVVCTASVEYLVRPQEVLAEVRRLLRPGGVFIVTFSNRWFPTKAIRVWSELHEFERVGMVTQWFAQAGFERLHTFSSRGWPRPPADPHAGETALSDPLYAVWGYQPAG